MLYSEIFKNIDDIIKAEVYKDARIKTFAYLWGMDQLTDKKSAGHCLFIIPQKMCPASFEKTDENYSLLLLSDEYYEEIKTLFARSNMAVMKAFDVRARQKAFTTIQNSFTGDDYIGESMMRLTYLNRAEVSVHELVQEMYAILQNPLTVVDTDLDKVTESSAGRIGNASFERGILDHDVVDCINDIIEKKVTRPDDSTIGKVTIVNLRYTPDGSPDGGVFIIETRSSPYSYVISQLLIRKNHFGYLFMECSERPVTLSDLKVFEFGSMAIANRIWESTNEIHGTGIGDRHKLMTFKSILSNICPTSAGKNKCTPITVGLDVAAPSAI